VPAFNTQIAGPEHGMNIAQKREGRLIRPTARYIGPGPRLADSVTGAAPA
jgi:citrate synthase